MFFGDTCSESVHCRDHKCASGSTCAPDMTLGDYSCDCAIGKIGRLCDTGKLTDSGTGMSKHNFFYNNPSDGALLR